MRRSSASRTTARIRGVPSWSRLAAVLCAAALSANCQAITPVPDRVVLITLDTVRADRLPAYGFQGVSTPALDRLAAEGIVFEDAVAPVPLTLPSHVSLLTGRWPTRHGIRDNADAALAPAVLTLAEVLRDRGVAYGRVRRLCGPAVRSGPRAGVRRAMSTCRRARAETSPSDGATATSLWMTRWRGSIRTRSGHSSRGSICTMHTGPTTRRSAYANRHGDPYLDAIAFQDSQVARIVEQLESQRLLDRTIVVVAADHGESLGEHGEDGHGIFLYESTLRVPLIVRVPSPPTRPGELNRAAR